MASPTEVNSSTSIEPFHVLANPIGPACNLACEYCYYLDTAEDFPTGTDFRMSEETLEQYIRSYLSAHPGPVVPFAWQGGEPTLRGIEFFRRVVELQQEHAPDGIGVQNMLQTNGTRLTDEWCSFLREEEFLVGISIDGPADLHNEFRRTATGGATHSDVMAGLELLKQHGVDYNVLCVVNRVNAREPERVYNFYRDNDIEWLQFIPCVEPTADGESAPSLREDDVPTPEPPTWVQSALAESVGGEMNQAVVLEEARNHGVTERSVDPAQWGGFLTTIFEEWVRTDIGRRSIQLFDDCIARMLGHEASLCVHTETCGGQIAIEHDGSVYSCDHFVEPGYQLGNIHDDSLERLVESDQLERFGRYKRDGLPDRCRSCPVRQYCHGGCPKDRHLTSPNGELGLNYLCAGYSQFFGHVHAYRPLVEEVHRDGLPLEFVMDAVAARDE